MPYTKSDWKADRRALSNRRIGALKRIRVRGREIKALEGKNDQRTRTINTQYEQALTWVNQRYAKARGMKF